MAQTLALAPTVTLPRLALHATLTLALALTLTLTLTLTLGGAYAPGATARELQLHGGAG